MKFKVGDLVVFNESTPNPSFRGKKAQVAHIGTEEITVILTQDVYGPYKVGSTCSFLPERLSLQNATPDGQMPPDGDGQMPPTGDGRIEVTLPDGSKRKVWL